MATKPIKPPTRKTPPDPPPSTFIAHVRALKVGQGMEAPDGMKIEAVRTVRSKVKFEDKLSHREGREFNVWPVAETIWIKRVS